MTRPPGRPVTSVPSLFARSVVRSFVPTAATSSGAAPTTTDAVRAAGGSGSPAEERNAARQNHGSRAARRQARHRDARLAMLVVYAARNMVTPVVRGLAAIAAVRRLIELALDEDLGRGDATSQAVFGDGSMTR